MEREEIIKLIKSKNKTTLVKAFIQSKVELDFEGVKVFGNKELYLVFCNNGDYLEYEDYIKDYSNYE